MKADQLQKGGETMDLTTKAGREELRRILDDIYKLQPNSKPALATVSELCWFIDLADAGEWRPIESAPKDGTHILAYRNGGVDEAWWHDDCDVIPGWFGWGGSSWRYPEWDQPTDWMPKPPPPPARAAAVEDRK